MIKRKVGLYLGVDSLGGVVLEKNKVISLARYDLVSLEEESKVEDLNEDVKWEALINRTLRDIGAEGRDVCVSLADKDFIFRSFEMPLMKKKELEVSVAYEVEKYIPFKLDQLRWDFTFKSFPKEKKVIVSFVGIREASFQRAYDIVSRLDLNPVALEPSSFSLARVIKSSKKLSRVKNYALLDYTKSEAYITFFYEDMPVFSRFFIVPKTDDGELDHDKLLETIRMSFQYFQRELKSYKLDNFIIVGNSRDERLGVLIKEELAVEVELMMAYDFTERSESTVENLKAMGVAGFESSAYKFKPDFLTKPEEKIQESFARETSLNLGLLVFVGGLGGFLLFIFWVILSNISGVAQTQLTQKQKALKVPESIQGLPIDKITEQVNYKTKGAQVLKTLSKPSKKFESFFQRLARVLPEGMWLEGLEIKSSGDNQYLATMTGAVFLGDGYRERGSIDKFITYLLADPKVRTVFNDIQLVSAENKNERGYVITSFIIRMQ